MGRDDELPAGVDGVDQTGNEVGERFADAGAGFEQEGFVALHRGGDGAGHLFLLRPVVELQSGLQPAVLGENFRSEGGRVAGRRRRGAGFVAKADHEIESANQWIERRRAQMNLPNVAMAGNVGPWNRTIKRARSGWQSWSGSCGRSPG